MKNKALTIFLGGMVMGIGLYVAPSAQAGELPDADLHNQLSTSINEQVATDVNKSLSKDPVSAPETATPASSSTTTPSNASPLIINTGGNADIDASTNQSSSTAVSNDNQAGVGQKVKASANTGNNTANGNISFGGNAGTIHTGDATVYSELVAADLDCLRHNNELFT